LGSSSWIPEFIGASSARAFSNPYEVAAASPWQGLPNAISSLSVPKDPTRPLAGTVNNSFWQWTRSGLNYYFNPDTIGVNVYEEMVTSDESCYAAMEFLTLATLAKFGPYRHQDPAIQDWVNESIANMDTPWLDVLKEQMTAFWAGHSAGEIIAEYDGQWVRPKQVQGLHPGTITYDLWLDGPLKNRLRAVRQWRFGAFQSYLPAEKAIVFTHGKRWGNVYGQSRLRSCWRSWFLKAKMLAAWALTLERYGSPHAVAKTSGGYQTIVDPETGAETPVLEFMNKLLQNLAVGGSVATTDDISIELFQAKQSVGSDFGGFIDYLDMMIMRGALIPSLVGQHGSSGSYALGRNHYDLFVLMLEEAAAQINNVNIQQFVKPLIDLNFGPQKSYGVFSIEDFKQDDEKILAEAFLDLVNSGVVKPGLAKDLNALRERVGFSPLSQEEIDSQPAAPGPSGEAKPTTKGESVAEEPPEADPIPSDHSAWPTRPKKSPRPPSCRPLFSRQESLR